MIKILKANLILLFCLFCVAPHSMQAQNYIGLRTGVNFANVTKTSTMGNITKDRIPLLGAELHLKFSLGAKWAIQAELHLIQRGFNRRVTTSTDYHYELNYFNFSPLVQYRFKQKAVKGSKRKRKKQHWEGYLTTGPYFGRGLSGKTVNQSTNEKRAYDFDGHLGIRLHRPDIGMIGGFGILSSFQYVNFIFDARYSHSLISINGNGGLDGPLRNTGIMLSLGAEFKISK